LAERNSPAKTGRRHTRDFNVGLPARRAAVALLTAVLRERQPLDEALANSPASRLMASMAERDRGLARAIVSTALRRKGQIDDVLGRFLDRKLPRRAGLLPEILLASACQLLFLDTPAHAAIDLAVTLAKQDRQARHFDKLCNAVLRRVAENGPGIVAKQDAAQLNAPDWLWSRWTVTYRETTARRIAEAHLEEVALDISVKSDPEGWAKRLGGIALDTGTVRLAGAGRVESLDGFADGEWWVQDAAAALPARLLGDVRGKYVADLCAAPGGKTAQLANMGAHVTAVDVSGWRLKRLKKNLARLKLGAEIVEADAGAWRPEREYDAVLLDAPCTGTGTIRRHPDIALLKSEKDLEELTAVQARLLTHAVTLLMTGGTLVYCTCSLEPEEGEAQVARALKENSGLRADLVRSNEIAGHDGWLTGDGFLRTLPCSLENADRKVAGMDGFFAARLVRNADK
jgi:16S rRNA (cytosine967-C5)-methyltransferase